jgi:hypothetical protein
LHYLWGRRKLPCGIVDSGLVVIKVEINRLNAKDEVLEQPQRVEYSLEQLNYVSPKEIVLL